MNKHLISLAIAVGFGIGGNAFAQDAMKAEGEYEVAREKCEDQQGAAAACKKDAKASYDKAKTTARQATAADTRSKS